VTSPPHDKSTDLRPPIRMDARLDATTRATVDDLARRFHRPRAAVLCHIMQWGLSCEHTEPVDQGDIQGPVRHLYLSVSSELYEQVEKAAAAAGLKIAPWLRHTVRQVTIEDFPASWQEATPPERSHDSHTYTERFMLRLNHTSSLKLQDLVDHFHVPKAAIIRHLITKAIPEDFPTSWHIRAAERHEPKAMSAQQANDQERKL
jgi:hypothetical protein